MAKRKRGDRDEEANNVGLGATLAQLRDEQLPNAAVDGKDNHNQGWTVVGRSKRRRRQRSSSSSSRVKSPESVQRNESHARLEESQTAWHEQHYASPSTAYSDNPFSKKNERTGSSPPENPFSTYEPSQNNTQAEHAKARKLEKGYPAIEHSHHARPHSHVKISDLQSLVLYLLADGTAPQWVSVRNRGGIQQVVMLMVPGLELGMFTGRVALDSPLPAQLENDNVAITPSANDDCTTDDNASFKRLHISPDDFYPAKLKPEELPAPLKPLSDMFEHVWPIKMSGEHRANQYFKVHSPIHSMLTSQIPKTREEKQMKKNSNHKGPVPQNTKHWDNQRTRITEYIASNADLLENDYVLHPACFTTIEARKAAQQKRKEDKNATEDGWVDTRVHNLDEGKIPEEQVEQGNVTAGRHVIAVDCEMCKAEDDTLVLTRISLLDWDGNVLLDKLVKPTVTIKDYLTQWSGVTASLLENVTTTLSDIQEELMKLITPHTILVGHSLNSDLNALKLTHPFLIDTGILFPHNRGPPYKQSLKWLAQKFLHREVQKGGKGHDSVEDAQTCLDLVKQKCEKGPRWGTNETNMESLFKRLGRHVRPKSTSDTRTGAVIDWGDPNRGHGGQAQMAVGCQSDADIVDATSRVLKGQVQDKEGTTGKIDLVWARLRELELGRGWWDDSKTADNKAMRQDALLRLGLVKDGDDEEDLEIKGIDLGGAVTRTVNCIAQIFESLPPCTAFIVYSGIGDPREVRRLQAMQQQYRREYSTKKWDELSVKWTDTEVQALSKACQVARDGIGLVTVK